MTVSNQIIEVLNYLGEKLGIAIDWSSENVVPYITTLCQKLISYEIWTSVAGMGLVLFLAIIGSILAIVYRKQLKEGWEYADFGAVAATTVLVAIYVATIIVVGVETFDIIKCITFPEMYVFEYVQSLVNSAK